MKLELLTLSACLGLLGVCPCFGQAPPPNDNFANRTVLTGTDVTFTGTLAGATLENSQESATYDSYISPSASQSVWWTWTAPVTTTLTLQALSSSLDQLQGQTPDGLFIYYATNGSSSPSGLALPPLGRSFVYFRLSPVTLSIPVTAGSNYQIQLIGSSSASYTFQLIATNTPIIIRQPQSRTVYSNASALFYVVSAGIPQQSFAFQWYFNGNALSGETGPMLARTNINSNMVGNYFVVVSNSSGGTTSQVATLSISPSNAPVSLSVVCMRSNSLTFALIGENGRTYRIQSSTNLVNWASEASFPLNPFWPDSTSVVLNTNSPLMLTVTNNAACKFFRATPYVLSQPDAEICVNNLQEISIAKMLWQRDANATDSQGIDGPISEPVAFFLLPYFPHQAYPFCPDDYFQMFDTSYNLNNLLVSPACQLHPTTHLLEEPQ